MDELTKKEKKAYRKALKQAMKKASYELLTDQELQIRELKMVLTIIVVIMIVSIAGYIIHVKFF